MSIRNSERQNAAAAPAGAPIPATPGLIRSINDRLVLDLLLEHKSLSRGDVRRLTGVSKPTASQSLTRLEDSGHVVPAGYSDSNIGGRASLIYELNPSSGFAAAVDVTTTGVHARVANILGIVVGESRLPSTATENGPRLALRAVETAVSAAGITADDVSSIVIAAPGSYAPEADVLRYADHLAGWQEEGLVARLSEESGVPVYVENDVNAVAVAEHTAGAVQDADSFFLFWIDERIGGALMIGNRLYRGATGGAGEVAFLQLPGVAVVRNPERENHGGFEDLVGQPRIVELAAGRSLTGDSAAQQIATAASSTDTAAGEFLDDIAERYATGLASVIAMLDPARIVIAGELMRAGGQNLLTRISAKLDELALSTPELAVGLVESFPALTGALLVSLEHTRNEVFST